MGKELFERDLSKAKITISQNDGLMIKYDLARSIDQQLILACRNGDIHQVKILIKEKNADIYCRSYIKMRDGLEKLKVHESPMLNAVRSKNLVLVKYLLEQAITSEQSKELVFGYDNEAINTVILNSENSEILINMISYIPNANHRIAEISRIFENKQEILGYSQDDFTKTVESNRFLITKISQKKCVKSTNILRSSI